MVDFDEALIRPHHVQEAIRRFLREPLAVRPARSAFLIHEGQRLPAKAIIRLAFQLATGTLPHSEQLTGGKASVRVLRALGFDALYDRTTVTGGIRNAVKSRRRESLRLMLQEEFGETTTEHKIDGVVVPDLAERSGLSVAEASVLASVEAVRGYRVSGRRGHRLAFDIFVRGPRILIEFDERQHFTPARAAALRAYPSKMELGFDIDRWITLCEQIRAGDNYPKFRDEQRAFYDALRDLAPDRLEMPPIVRVFEEDVRWECEGARQSKHAALLMRRIAQLSRKK